jgi:hypothetical protein
MANGKGILFVSGIGTTYFHLKFENGSTTADKVSSNLSG